MSEERHCHKAILSNSAVSGKVPTTPSLLNKIMKKKGNIFCLLATSVYIVL